MKFSFNAGQIQINGAGKEYEAEIGDKVLVVQVLRVEDRRYDFLIDGRHVAACVSSSGAQRWVTVNGKTSALMKTSGAGKSARHESGSGLAAPMPGQVRVIAAQAGDHVHKGQTLMTIEAMKMEIRIQSTKDGKVKAVHASAGDSVEREQILIELED